MNKLDLIQKYCLFEMLDENNTKIVDKIRFPRIPFISTEDLINNKEILLSGGSCLISNPLKDFYIRIKDIKDAPKLTDKEIISIYENKILEGDDSYKIEKVFNSIKIKRYSDLMDFDYTILEFRYKDENVYNVSFDKDMKLEKILSLLFLDVDYYTYASDPCF